MCVTKSGWTSNDKEQFESGKDYWCFYMDVTKKGNKLRHLNGVSLYKCTKATKEWRPFDEPTWDGRTGYWAGHTEFEHVSGKEIHHAYAYMDGYGRAICHFYNTEQEAKDGYDNRIKDYARDLSVYDKEIMYRKMFGLSPDAPKEEIEAMEFYKSLSNLDKVHVRWLKEYGNI